MANRLNYLRSHDSREYDTLYTFTGHVNTALEFFTAAEEGRRQQNEKPYLAKDYVHVLSTGRGGNQCFSERSSLDSAHIL